MASWVLKSQDVDLAREMITYLLNHCQAWVREETYGRLKHLYTEGTVSKMMDDFTMLSFMIEVGLSESSEKVIRTLNN